MTFLWLMTILDCTTLIYLHLREICTTQKWFYSVKKNQIILFVNKMSEASVYVQCPPKVWRQPVIFLEFQKHQLRNICQKYLNMSAVHLYTI